MSFRFFWVVISVLVAFPRGSSASPESPGASIEELLSYGEQHAPSLRVALRRLGHGAAEMAAADPPKYNPSFRFGLGPRFDESSGIDFVVALEQPVEIAGEASLRSAAGARLEERLSAEVDWARAALRRDVTLAFHTAVVAHHRIDVANRGAVFAEEVVSALERRLTAGEGTGIDVRVAKSELVRAQQSRIAAEAEYKAARLHLAELIGWPLDSPPEISSTLAPVVTPPRRELTMHPELRASQAATAEWAARGELLDREVWPAPVFGVEVSKEGSGEATSYTILGTLGLTLPVWQRNQGERARSQIDREVAELQVGAVEQSLRSRVAQVEAELAAAAQRLELHRSELTPHLEQNLSLLRKGLEAGELSILDVAWAREKFLTAELEALTAYSEYQRASAELEYLVGDPTKRGAP